MKNRGKNLVLLAAGILLGAVLAGPAAHAAAESWLKAFPSTLGFYVDGEKVELEAYSIEGTNYVKLRDVGIVVDFNVGYDPVHKAAVIQSDVPYIGDEIIMKDPTPTPDPKPSETPKPSENPGKEEEPKPYRINVDHWSRMDFSQEANPAVFKGVYSRELYNTIRQTMVDGTSAANPAYCMVAKGEEYSATKNLLVRLGGTVRYEHHVPANFVNYYEYLDYFAVSAAIPENYQAPLGFIQPIIAEVRQMDTDSEKVEYLNDYLCSLLFYDQNEVSGIPQTFTSHAGELKAACSSYARAFKFLCGAAGIPCFTISTGNHTWNMVYADGKWLHVDVSANDHYNRPYILLTETVSGRIDEAPEQTEFLKELLVPGSTK